MKIRDIMTTPAVCVTPGTTLAHAAVLLNRNGFASMPVVDSRQHIVGMLSETDIIGSQLTGTNNRAQTPAVVAEVMAVQLFTCTADTNVVDLSTRMLQRGLRSVPVVAADGTVTGIVSRRDIMRSLTHDQDALAAQVRYHLDGYWGSGRRWDVEVDNGAVTVTGDFHDDAERGVVRALAHIIPGITTIDTRTRGAVFTFNS